MKKKRWEDNIKECRGVELTDSQRAVNDWERSKEPVKLVPQRPYGLRDKAKVRMNVM